MPISKAMSEDVGIRMLRSLMYVGLTRNHKLTTDEVGDLMQDFINENGSIEKLNQIITSAFAEANLSGEKK